MKVVFWASLGVILYTYLLYPLLLLFLAGNWQLWRDLQFGLRRGNCRRRARGEDLPFVSVVFAVHNEAAIIEAKLRNCAALDYPADRMEIIVGCDGCEDATAEIARRTGLANLRVIEYPGRSGKPETLNKLAPEARGAVIVFSDANTEFGPEAVRNMARHFADERVGCVCGSLRLRAPNGGSETEGVYWRYESFLKFLESRMNMMVGANGGMFAVRKELYEPLPKRTIVDDFLISMKVRAREYRVLYDPEAVGYEETAPVSEEFRRRVRIGAGNIHALGFTWRLLSPTAGLVALSYWSHKVLRWLVPFAMLASFAASIALAAQTFYAVFAALFTWFVLMGWIGYRLERHNIRIPVLSIPCYFLSLNLALLCGFFLFLFGRQRGVWTPTARAEAPAESETADSRR